MVIEISIGVVAAAFVLLVIYLMFTFRNINKTLVQLRQTTDSLETDTHKILINADGLITETRQVVNQIKSKTENADTLFQAINQIGKQVNEVSVSISKVAEQHKEKLGGLFAVLSAIVNLAQEWRQNNQKRRMNDGQP